MKTSTKRLLLLLSVAFLSFSQVHGQFDQISDMLKAGRDDAQKLSGAYLEPLGKGWGYTLADGWYNTASTHQTLGFSLNFSFNMAQVPDIAKTFDMADLNLEVIEPSNPSNTIFPTVLNGDAPNSFVIPPANEPIELSGESFPVVPLPTLTGAIGLVKNTDLMFRFIPNVGMGNLGTIGLWGLGFRHDLLQWLPIVDKIPIVKATYFLGYSRLNYSKDLNDDGSQKLDASLGALHTALLVGLNLPIINPYVSVGLTSSNMNMDLLGTYDVAGQETLTDPFSLEFQNKLAPSFGAGLRLKLGVLTLHGQYTFQEYNSINAGIGISFR